MLSRRELMEKLNLLARLDCRSFDGTNAFDCFFGRFSLRNEIRRQYRSGATETGFAMNRNRFVLRSLPIHKFYKLSCLFKVSRSAIRDWKT